MAFYSPLIMEVHVLLVDSDMKFLLETTEMLQHYSYKVTAVQETSIAYSMLSNAERKFDLAMIDLNASGLNFMHNAIKMGLTVILMTTHADATLVKTAIEEGAFLLMEKPISQHELKYLWQHVLRESSKIPNEDIGYTGKSSVTTTGQSTSKNKGIITNHQEPEVEYIQFNRNESGLNQTPKHKGCIEWTPELEKKFTDAIKELGDGRCFPKNIMEIMNVPGLTRMQVASHLQKCRYGSKQYSSRGIRSNTPEASSSSECRANRTRPTKYGKAPEIVREVSAREFPSQVYNNRQQEQHLVFSSPSTNLEFSPLGMGQQLETMYDLNTPINIDTIDQMIDQHYDNETVLENTLSLTEMGASLELGLADYNGHPENNFDFQQFDYDYFPYMEQVSDPVVDNEMEDLGFWSSSVVNFSRD